MGALPVTKISVEEYLALDRAAEVPSEYHDGEMLPIEAVTWEHGLLQVNAGTLLKEHLRSSPCRVAGPALRVRVSPTKFVLPDLVVVCGKPVLADEYQDTLTNPKVIVEILSPSTMNYDYGEKFSLYRRLESFEEYILVWQDRPRVEVLRKTLDKRWILSTFEDLSASVEVESLGISLPLAQLYADVEFPALVDD